MTALPVGVVINPTSGKGRGARVADEVWQALADTETIDLSADTYAEALANAKTAVAASRLSALLVVGGDGMVHLGVNACVNTEVPLAVVAAGTGNDAAAALGLPLQDAAEAVRVALEWRDRPRAVDLIEGSARVDTGAPEGSRKFYSLGTVSAGFDALVNARANRMSWPKGPSRYQLAIALELVKFRGIKYTAVVDGLERKLEAMLCAVANVPSFGGGMQIVPHARLDDGTLDLFVVHRVKRTTFLKIFPTVYKGGHVTHPAVEFVAATSIRIDNGDHPAYSDGEFIGYSPISATVAPRALLVCAPAK